MNITETSNKFDLISNMSDLFNLEVYVSNETVIDFDIFQLWLDGYSAEDAANYQMNEFNVASEDLNLLIRDITDEYRLIWILETYLVDPTKFNNQMEFLIGKQNQSLLLEMYYEFDDDVIREIISKKLSSRHRNLEDICEKVNINNKSVKRQFDNFKRVFKKVEDVETKLVDSIIISFKLSQSLAQEYAVAVFIANNRLDLFKKKIIHLPFNVIISCAKIIMASWTTFSQNEENESEYDGEVNKHFMQELKSLKILLKKDVYEDHKRLILKELSETGMCLTTLDENFKLLTKSIVTIGLTISNLKCLKEFFSELQEKFIEICLSLRWSKDDLRLFFELYIKSVSNILPIKKYYRPSTFHFMCSKYVNTVADCVQILYEI